MKYLFAVLSPLWFLISFLFPKSNKIWLYGAWFGERYSDNSKIFFEYCSLIDRNNDMSHYWIFKNYNIEKEILDKGFKGVYAYSLKGIYLQLRAKVLIVSVNSSDFIPFLVSPRNYLIQLFHGSPIKHIGIDSRKTGIRKFLDRIRHLTLDNYDLIVSPSKLIDNNYISAFCSNKTHIFRGGYPRNEMLFVNDETLIKIKEYFNISKTGKIIAYLPTHRQEGKGTSPFKDILIEILKGNELLKQNDITIIVKPHFYEKDTLNDVISASNVRIVYDLPFDLYNFLGSCDALITDYSSVMFDYELLNRTIFVYPFDYEEYTSLDRGLYFEFDFLYETLARTKMVTSTKELLAEITKKNHYSALTKETLNYNVEGREYCKGLRAKIIDETE